MAENSSDSDSSCGWTVINHDEGCDVEAVTSEYQGASDHAELALEESTTLVQDGEQAELLADLQAEFDLSSIPSVVTQSSSTSEPTKPVPEEEKEKLPKESFCVGASDDSDIVTLETPKVEEIGALDQVLPAGEEVHVSEEFNMGSSSSSQYTFCQPETVFPPHASGEESSSDETSHCSSPALRRRRAKKRPTSVSESEGALPREHETESVKDQLHKHPFSSGLNRCIILALVIAVSMGFGHFYGTIQIQKRQQLVEKTHEDELNGMKDHLIQCQQGQGVKVECKFLKEGLETCLLTTEKEKDLFESQKHNLASENQHLRESLEREEKALASLQEELRKLREQMRQLENKGTGPELVVTENQNLKAHLEEEKHKVKSFVKQKETLLAEAQMLRRELDKERQLTEALRGELDKLSSQQVDAEAGASAGLRQNQEIETLRERLSELEKKLSFEQQRSDLWEKLYVEVKGHAENQDRVGKAQKEGGKGAGKSRKKPKATFFGSVKETFDAMKNSTKEFVRHHKEKIKQAKEAVKENLRKFSDSVKSTFRHFKDTTKNIFDEKEKKKYGDKRQDPHRKAKTVYRASSSQEGERHQAPGSQRESREGRRSRESRSLYPHRDSASQDCMKGPEHNRKSCMVLKGCSGIFDCAHQEFVSLFNKVLDPIRAEEFNQLMRRYLQQEVDSFHHWRELENFMGRFFHNGVFIHDQMLFTDFVHDVKDYLGDLKEYQRAREDGSFEDLDKYIYRYYFHYDHSPQHGLNPPAKRPPFTHAQNPHQERQAPKYQQRYKREGKWHKDGHHMANLEIDLGQLPMEPKY